MSQNHPDSVNPEQVKLWDQVLMNTITDNFVCLRHKEKGLELYDIAKALD